MTKNITNEQILELAREINTEEIAMAIEKLNQGDYYGDTIVDSLGDIAHSLRILSGRESLK